MQNFSKSWYDGLETQLRTRFNHVENLLISYTLSRTFRDGVDFFGTPRGTQRTPHEVGYTETDQRHNLAISAASTLPGLIQISGIGKFVSGSPFHDQAGVDLDGDGTITNDRPAGLDTSVGRRDVDQSLQIVNGFRASRGLAPIPASLLKLDPYVSLDARVTKVIPLSANRRLDLFFEGYNLTNHENFSLQHQREHRVVQFSRPEWSAAAAPAAVGIPLRVLIGMAPGEAAAGRTAPVETQGGML